ncbi:GntR family transcriptional regulator [Sesbania bispinosa]|nr:GntR family transcriptional regulator [Sesbania bispinosa]
MATGGGAFGAADGEGQHSRDGGYVSIRELSIRDSEACVHMSFNAPGIASFKLLHLDNCWTWKIRWCLWRSNDCYRTSTAAVAWMRKINFYLDKDNQLQHLDEDELQLLHFKIS